MNIIELNAKIEKLVQEAKDKQIFQKAASIARIFGVRDKRDRSGSYVYTLDRVLNVYNGGNRFWTNFITAPDEGRELVSIRIDYATVFVAAFDSDRCEVTEVRCYKPNTWWINLLEIKNFRQAMATEQEVRDNERTRPLTDEEKIRAKNFGIKVD